MSASSPRILHAADLHIGRYIYGWRLFDDQQLLDRMVVDAQAQDVDMVIVAGDVFHTRRPSAPEILVLVRFLRMLTAAGIDVVVSPGNHDGPGTILDPAAKSAAWLEAVAMPRVHAYPVAAVDEVRGVSIASLPYPHKRSFDTKLRDLSLEDRIEHVGRQAEAAIEGLWEQLLARGTGHDAIFVGHLTVAGARLSEERAMALGWDVTVRPDVLAPFSYSALGHIHKQQPIDGAVGWYAGSPKSLSFGEADQKGWLIVELGEGEVTVRPRESGAPVFLTVEHGQLPEELPPAAVVRFRYPDTLLAGEIRDTVQLLRDMGAGWVERDPQRADRPLRARVELDPNADAIEGLEAWLRSQGLPVDPYLDEARKLLEASRAG